jgi:Fe-S-cluster-containing dehydrogenase component
LVEWLFALFLSHVKYHDLDMCTDCEKCGLICRRENSKWQIEEDFYVKEMVHQRLETPLVMMFVASFCLI